MKGKDILKTKEGYKIKIEVNTSDLNISVDARYKRMTSKDVVEPVIFKDSEGNEVVRKYIGEPRHLEWRRKDNPELPAVGEIKAYQQGKPVKPFPRSEKLEIKKFMPYGFKENFLIERTFEVWAEEEGDLLSLAKYMYAKDLVGLCAFVPTQGYDTQYLGILEVRFYENKYGFMLSCAKKQLTFEHLAEVEAKQQVKAEKPADLEILQTIF